MPITDGVQATKQIMAKTPCAILIVTTSIDINADKVFEAMGYGALDAVDTPVLGAQDLRESAKPLLALVDREEGGREQLESLGLPVQALTTASEIIPHIAST